MSDDIKKKILITEQHEELYTELFEQLVNKAVDNDHQMVASVYLALGLKLYRSCLPKEDFQRLLNDVCSSAVDIEPFEKENKEKENKEILH
jgi:hypothetical protein|tara:strand:- start:3809 stop:4081 length:273 start_codon:yes stop_codon:yes gene_type:complete